MMFKTRQVIYECETGEIIIFRPAIDQVWLCMFSQVLGPFTFEQFEQACRLALEMKKDEQK